MKRHDRQFAENNRRTRSGGGSAVLDKGCITRVTRRDYSLFQIGKRSQDPSAPILPCTNNLRLPWISSGPRSSLSSLFSHSLCARALHILGQSVAPGLAHMALPLLQTDASCEIMSAASVPATDTRWSALRAYMGIIIDQSTP